MEINYQATKTAAEFHASNAYVRLMMGPVGCGKSVADCAEVFRRAYEQEPGDDGIRRSRWGIVRNTYPELKSTTIKTWQEWFPENIFGKIKWDSPISHRLHLPNFDLEVIFLALDSELDVKKLMSFEFTGIYINELQYVHPKIFEKCQERVNRYPAKRSGARITWTGVIADTNPPSTRHWIYQLFEKDKPSNFEIFKFVPALKIVDTTPSDSVYAISRDKTIYVPNLEADYVNNLEAAFSYYLNQVPGKTDEEIKVSILGEYGVFISGKPVHPEYTDKIHYANKKLIGNPEIEIGLGWDFGLTPACAIVQFTPEGQFVILDELWSEHKGLDGFVEDEVLPFLNRHYPWWKDNHISRHDPAGQVGAQTDMQTCQQILKKHGIHSLPAASSNAPTARRNGLKYHLRRLVDGKPGLLLSNTCQQIREGLMGHFQYAPIQTSEGHETRYHEKPLKNMHSHICEAAEYIGMYYAKSEEKTDFKSNPVIDMTIKSFSRLNQKKARRWQN